MNEAGANEAVAMPDDWQALGEQWRGQQVDAIDIDLLRAQVRRRGTRLRVWLSIEVAATVLAVVMFGAMVLQPGRLDPAGKTLMVVLALALVAWQGWSLWIRRRQLRVEGLDAAGMLGLELERAHTSIRYWRWCTWVVVALWLLIVCAIAFGMPDDSVMRRVLSPPAVHANSVLIGACGVLSWWRGRRARARIGVLHALREQLER